MRKKYGGGQCAPRWRYTVISERCAHVDSGLVHTYGIRLTGPGQNKTLHDISCCEDAVVRMAALFNRHQLSPWHFQDTVEDLLPCTHCGAHEIAMVV